MQLSSRAGDSPARVEIVNDRAVIDGRPAEWVRDHAAEIEAAQRRIEAKSKP